MREKESGVPCFHQFHYKQLNVRGGGDILDEWTRRKNIQKTPQRYITQ